jgi:predicted nucleic acid-binding protein
LTVLVLDASVAAKWYLPRSTETLTEQAFELLSGHVEQRVHLAVPDLFWAELGNLLWKAWRQGRLGADSIREAMVNARELGIAEVPSKDVLDQAVSLAMATERSVYDSLYIALAMRLNTEVITADERLFNAVGARFPVRWLGRCDLSGGGL